MAMITGIAEAIQAASKPAIHASVSAWASALPGGTILALLLAWATSAVFVAMTSQNAFDLAAVAFVQPAVVATPTRL
jgi:hypothetical protein